MTSYDYFLRFKRVSKPLKVYKRNAQVHVHTQSASDHPSICVKPFYLTSMNALILPKANALLVYFKLSLKQEFALFGGPTHRTRLRAVFVKMFIQQQQLGPMEPFILKHYGSLLREFNFNSSLLHHAINLWNLEPFFDRTRSVIHLTYCMEEHSLYQSLYYPATHFKMHVTAMVIDALMPEHFESECLYPQDCFTKFKKNSIYQAFGPEGGNRLLKLKIPKQNFNSSTQSLVICVGISYYKLQVGAYQTLTKYGAMTVKQVI